MRRADRAGRQDDFARRVGPLGIAVAREFDADRTRAVEHDAVDQGLGDEFEVWALQGGPQIGPRGAGAAPAAAGLLAPADAVAGARRQIVDIGPVFDAELAGGVDD